MHIVTRAPTRIDLAGGTLDIWPLYLFHPGALTVNCAVTLYASCTIQTRAKQSEISLESKDTHRTDRFASLDALAKAKRYRLPLLARLVCHFKPRGGFSLFTDSQAPAGAGIGGSSAMAVAICAALDRLTNAELSPVDWIHISRDVEAVVIGVPTGTQDHYPPAFGGASVVHLEAGGEQREALRVDLGELERRLFLCYSGKPRQSGINNWKVFQAHINGDRRIRGNLEKIAGIARAMRVALERGEWKEAGRLMRQEWAYRRHNLPSISTPVVDRIIAAGLRAGATGGKVCGAGGGGCVAMLIDPDARERVNAAVARAGGRILPVQIDRDGVQVTVLR